MSIGHSALGRRILGSPLLCARRAGRQLPVIRQEVVQKPVVPRGRRFGPGALQPAGGGVVALPAAKSVLPAEALLLEGRRFGFRPDVLGTACPMGFADRVAADNER